MGGTYSLIRDGEQRPPRLTERLFTPYLHHSMMWDSPSLSFPISTSWCVMRHKEMVGRPYGCCTNKAPAPFLSPTLLLKSCLFYAVLGQ